MADQKVSAQALSNTFGANDVVTGLQSGLNKRFSKTALRSINGIAGTWDMTQTLADTTPDAAFVLEASVTTNGAHDLDMIPSSGASQIKMAGSNAAVAFPTTARSSRMRVTAAGGANLPLQAILFANKEAVTADIIAVLFGGSPVGTCSHLVSVLIDIAGVGPGVMAVGVNFVSASQNNVQEVPVAASGIVAGDEVYATLNVNGTVSITVNAGSPVTTAEAIDTSFLDGLRIVALGYYGSAATPVGTINFDFSDNTSGRTGFSTIIDPALPVGAHNGMRYEVSVAGGFNWKHTAVGDIVELKDAMTDIIVIQADPISAADVADIADQAIAAFAAANPLPTLLETARARAYCYGIEDDYNLGGLGRGDTVMVGSAPSGAFAGFTHGNLAIWDGAAFEEHPPSSFFGVNFESPNANWGRQTMRYGQYQFNTNSYDNGSTIQGYPCADLFALGWVFNPIIRNGLLTTGEPVALTESGTDSVVLGTCEQFIFTTPTSGNYTLSFGNNGSSLITINGIHPSGVASITIPGLGYPFKLLFGESAVFSVEGNTAFLLRVFGRSAGWIEASSVYDPRFLGAWVNAGGSDQTVQYRMLGDRVDVRGSASTGTTSAVFNLPVPFRPSTGNIEVPISIRDGAGDPALGRCVVQTDGDVNVVRPAAITGHTVSFNFSFSISPESTV